MRLRINGPHAMVVEIAARIASRDGRAPRESRNFKNSDLPPRSRTALSIASGRGSLASAAVATKSARVCASTLIALQSKPSSRESNKPEWAKRSISLAAHASARSTRLGPMIAAAAAITVFGELPPSRARSEEHTSELQSRRDLVCRLLLEKKKKKKITLTTDQKKNKQTNTQ